MSVCPCEGEKVGLYTVTSALSPATQAVWVERERRPLAIGWKKNKISRKKKTTTTTTKGSSFKMTKPMRLNKRCSRRRKKKSWIIDIIVRNNKNLIMRVIGLTFRNYSLSTSRRRRRSTRHFQSRNEVSAAAWSAGRPASQPASQPADRFTFHADARSCSTSQVKMSASLCLLLVCWNWIEIN